MGSQPKAQKSRYDAEFDEAEDIDESEDIKDDFEEAEEVKGDKEKTEDFKDDMDDDTSSELKKYQEKAIKGIAGLQEFQLQSPFEDKRVPQDTMNKWIEKIKNATQLSEIVLLGEEINDQTGYDIMIDDEEEEDDDYKDDFEHYDPFEGHDDQDKRFSGIEVAGHGDDKDDEEEDDIDDDIDDNFDDDFDF